MKLTDDYAAAGSADADENCVDERLTPGFVKSESRSTSIDQDSTCSLEGTASCPVRHAALE
jgi:hypothetical protein